MQALRLNEVLTRVVAWHNRHPLARRISALQVHSIGEVVLPFASAQAAPAPPAPPTTPALPAMQDLLDPAAAPLAGLLVGLQASADSLALAAQPADPAAHTVASAKTDPPPETDLAHGAETVAPADPPSAPEDAPTEAAPGLSMEDQADDLFSKDAPPAGEPAPPPDDGPEMLIELSPDPDEPPPASPGSPADGPLPAADEPAAGLTAPDADSGEPAAAFAAATDLATALQAEAVAAAAPGSDLPAGPQGHPAPDPADGPLADPAVQQAAAEPAAGPPSELSVDARQPPAPQPQPGTASAPSAGLLARLRARLTGWRRGGGAGLPRLQATFSRDFIWPLRPGQVARWARRHGSVLPLAPADWPQRLIDTDGSLLAQARRQGLPHALPLHLLTAAIGVGDRRIRVLINAQGHILGPRSYSPPRLAALASLVALGLLGVGWGWRPQADSRSAKQASAAVAAAASAAAQAVSAAALAAAAAYAASAASAADRVWRAQQAGSTLAGAAPADAQLAVVPQAENGQAVAPDTAYTAAKPAKPTQPAPHGVAAEASAHAAAPAPESPTTISTTSTTLATTLAADPAVTPAQRQAAVSLGTILPVLSTADKLAARQQVEAARLGQAAAVAAQPPKPAAPVYALVTRPTHEKGSAARGLALIRASGQRLVGELPEHAELMLNQGQWRAAWWPFESLADAERARGMLAARGLKVEVVAF